MSVGEEGVWYVVDIFSQPYQSSIVLPSAYDTHINYLLIEYPVKRLYVPLVSLSKLTDQAALLNARSLLYLAVKQQ
jgi:hypothetical protein